MRVLSPVLNLRQIRRQVREPACCTGTHHQPKAQQSCSAALPAIYRPYLTTTFLGEPQVEDVGTVAYSYFRCDSLLVCTGRTHLSLRGCTQVWASRGWPTWKAACARGRRQSHALSLDAGPAVQPGSTA